MESSIEILGLGELARDLRKLQDKMTKKELIKLLRPGANILLKEIKAQTPRRTGTLQRSLRLRQGRGDANAPYASLFTNFKKNYTARSGKLVYPFYVTFVHFGTVTSAGKRKHRKGASSGRTRIRANQFVYRAFSAKVAEATRVILDKISKSLEQ